MARVAPPGSPRPPSAPGGDDGDGVYRSLFQQPLIDIPPRAPSYAWFEFLLHPAALQQHLQALRQQNARGAHGATSAMELVREFLDQAQLVADEGHGRNNRYKALLLVAAQVALQMRLPLAKIEQALPLHFQRLLVDGIVDLADAPRTPFTADIALAPSDARLLHHRWTLRALVSQSQSGYLTASTRGEADELLTGFQSALGDLMASHLQIAKSVQAALVGGDDDEQPQSQPRPPSQTPQPPPLAKQTQLDAFVDLGVYFFSFNGYEKAYECFSRAAELADDFGDAIVLMQDEKDSLEGYLAACEAVLEARSVAEGDTLAKSPKAQLELAWESRDWDRVCHLLAQDTVAYELTRLPPGYRAVLEQRALRIVRAQSSAFGGSEQQASLAAARSLHQRIAVSNALQHVVQTDASLALETSVCAVLRLLQEEIFHHACVASQAEPSAAGRRHPHSNNSFPELASFTLGLASFLFANVAKRAKQRLQLVLARIIQAFPSVLTLDGVRTQLERCELPSVRPSTGATIDLTQLLATETFLQVSADKQRAHLRLASDLSGLFAFERPSDREAFVGLLRAELGSLGAAADSTSLAALDTDSQSGAWTNVIAFCTLHGCWDALAQWKAVAPRQSLLGHQLEFAGACGALMQYFSSLESSAHGEGDKPEFSILTSNRLVAEILFKRRQVLEAFAAANSSSPETVDDADAEAQQLLIDLPLWILETLVCISAGLLHRAYMRNISDYRISFELTPYGDLAFLHAFAPENPKKRSQGTDGGGGGGDSDAKEASSSSSSSVDNGSGGSFLTAPFMKSFQADLVALHSSGLLCLAKRCSREPRWHCARADISLNPIVKQKLSSSSDPHAALKGYLAAASLATNFFSDATSVVDIIDQSSLVRLSQCLVKVGAHTAAAVLYQCFAPEEFKYGLRILQLVPEAHDERFFQYFWEMPFLELLVHLHSSPKHSNSSHVTLLTHLIQSPELNSSNPAPVLKGVEQRILRCYFRDLCRLFLS